MIRWMLQRKQSARAARRVCRGIKGKGSKGVSITVLYSPDWTERDAVDEALRDEQKKRGLR